MLAKGTQFLLCIGDNTAATAKDAFALTGLLYQLAEAVQLARTEEMMTGTLAWKYDLTFNEGHYLLDVKVEWKKPDSSPVVFPRIKITSRMIGLVDFDVGVTTGHMGLVASAIVVGLTKGTQSLVAQGQLLEQTAVNPSP